MFKVGLTRDFLTPEGKLSYSDIGLDILEDAGISYEFMSEYRSPVTSDMIAGYDAIISLAPAYDKNSFAGVSRIQAICRFGVGYDMIDLKACTAANVIVTITRGAVNHSIAESIICWMLALSHRLLEKNRLVRNGKWAERSHYTGTELRNRTLGIIGFGGIGQKLVEMLQPFGMQQVLAFDPYGDQSAAERLGVKLVDLEILLKGSDIVSVNCPLTAETRNLVGYRELSMLRRSAFVINSARGGIINEEALEKALSEHLLAGYATDVFDKEPPPSDHPLFKFENVILAPHCIGWTHDLFSEIGRKACRQVVAIARGEIPDDVLNTEILTNRKPSTK